MELLPQTDQISRLIAKERDCLERHKDLIQEIKRIPHLPLPIPVDLPRLKEEAQVLSDYRSHVLHATKNLPQWYYDHHERSFRGHCLVDYTPHGERGMIDVVGHLHHEPDAQFDEQDRLIYFTTPWGQKTPRTLETLRQITPYLNRTRFIRTPPGGGIYWHSHHNGIYKNSYLRLAVIILTLDANEKCIHGVRDFRDQSAKVHSIQYEAGVPYLFNSWHDHDFWNKGTTDRWTIISYLNFPDDHFLKFLEPFVNDYKGERIAVD